MTACKPVLTPGAGASKAAMTAGAVAKVHTAAVAVVPPVAVWRQIQAIRCFRDKSFVRWPPHINLLYPFFPDDDRGRGATGGDAADAHGTGGSGCSVDGDAAFQSLAVRAGRALSGVSPFRVRLSRLRTFRHSARSLTVWAEPSLVPAHQGAGTPPAPFLGQGAIAAGSCGASCGAGTSGGGGGLIEVQRLLESEFPECSDLTRDEGRGIDGFVPHLSLGQLRHEDELQALQAAWQPLEFLVDSVQLISRQGYLSPFTIRYHVPLGLDLLESDPSLWRADPDLDSVSATAPALGAGPGSQTRARDVVRMDVPYTATMACLTSGACGAVGEEAASLRRRFASPCLVLSPPPPEPGPGPFRPAQSPPGEIPGGPGGGEDGPGPDSGGSQRAGWGGTGPSHIGARGNEAAGQGAGATGTATGLRAAVNAGPRAAASAGMEPYEGREAGLENACGGGGGESRAELSAARGAVDGRGGGSGGGYVWWFAYGCALAAQPHRLGAVESVAARLEGHRMAFNRRGGRANIVPDVPTRPPAAAGRPRDDPVATLGSVVAAVAAAGGAESLTTSADTAAGPSVSRNAAHDGSDGVDGKQGGSGDGGGVVAGGRGCKGGVDGGGVGLCGLTGPAPAVHGVLHKLSVDAMARLLLAVGDACPIEVRCTRYGTAVTHGRNSRACSPGGGERVGGGEDDGAGGSGLAGALGSEVAAVAFMAPPERCLAAADVSPTEGYLAALRQAYGLYDIDMGFQGWRAGVAPVPDAVGREPAYHSETGGRPFAGAGSGVWRTGAKKAAGALPRSATDW